MIPFQWPGRLLARFLSRPLRSYKPLRTTPPHVLRATLRPGDVLLVEGNTRFSVAIKYLTQSSWSHAAICIDAAEENGTDGPRLIEADVIEGVRIVDAARYENFHTRICRPVGLSAEEVQALVADLLARVGHQYDLKNIVDLVRYLIPVPPVPSHWRRRLLALGSGDPTRAICSSLIAEAFQRVRYPILPMIELGPSDDPACESCRSELYHIRHHSLFAPRDFDISPYFQIVKPTLETGFDPHRVAWAEPALPV